MTGSIAMAALLKVSALVVTILLIITAPSGVVRRWVPRPRCRMQYRRVGE